MQTVLWQRYKTVWLFVPLLFEPLRCVAPQTAAAAQFAPAIVITEGKTAQGYAYMSGGVGAEERIAMEERGKGFNVKFVFAEAGGAFVAAVHLEIATTKNQPVVTLTSTGPWFYIQLPEGNYHVKATFAGQTKEALGLRVARDRRVQRAFVWKIADAQNTGSAR